MEDVELCLPPRTDFPRDLFSSRAWYVCSSTASCQDEDFPAGGAHSPAREPLPVAFSFSLQGSRPNWDLHQTAGLRKLSSRTPISTSLTCARGWHRGTYTGG